MSDEPKSDADIRQWLQAIIDDETMATTDPAIVATREPTCYPHRLFVNGAERSVSCSMCSKVFEPFDALLYLSREWTIAAQNLDAMKGDIRRLAATRDGLRRAVHNLKAQEKRGEAKTRTDSHEALLELLVALGSAWNVSLDEKVKPSAVRAAEALERDMGRPISSDDRLRVFQRLYKERRAARGPVRRGKGKGIPL